MKDGLPTTGSQWRHHTGRTYTVIGVANITSLNEVYPTVVVYIGRNGNMWTKEVENFLAKMIELEDS